VECIPCRLPLNTVIPILLILLPFNFSFYNFCDVIFIVVSRTKERHFAMFYSTIFILEGPFRSPFGTKSVMTEGFHNPS